MWDLKINAKVREFRGHRHCVYAIAFSPGGDLLASASRDKTARVWELATGKTLWSIPDHRNEVHSVAFSLTGKALATGGDDGTIRLWDLVTGKEVRRFEKHSGQCNSLVFSSDGKTLVSAGNGSIPTGSGSVNVWDVASGRNWYRRAGGLFATIASPDSSTFAHYGPGFDAVEIASASTGTTIVKLSYPQSLVTEMAFSRDGRLLATAGPSQAIQIWDLAANRRVSPVGGHQQGLKAVVFTGDGKHVATASAEGMILWESGTGKQVRRVDERLRQEPVLAASPDGKRLALGARGGFVWEVSNGRLLHRIPESDLHGRWLAFARDSRSLISHAPDGGLRVWDPASGMQDAVLRSTEPLDFVQFQGVALSSDGKSAVAVGLDSRNSQTVCVQWETGSENAKRLVRGERALMVSLSPDGLHMAAADQDDVVRIYEATTGKEKIRFEVPRPDASGLRALMCLKLSPDGRTLATGHTDYSVRLWEVATGKERHRFVGHQDMVRCVAFAPDGKRIASASDDTTALVWAIPGTASGK